MMAWHPCVAVTAKQQPRETHVQKRRPFAAFWRRVVRAAPVLETQDQEERSRLDVNREKPVMVIEPQVMSPKAFHKKFAKHAAHCFKSFNHDQMIQFLDSVRSLVSMALALDGSGGFVCAPCDSYCHLQQIGVHFDIVDDSDDFPHGYMTEQLLGEHVTSFRSRKQIRAFAEHTGTDRWPADHEAAQLPKDGYLLFGSSGFCRLAAARLIGLPAAPYRWEQVGMRTTTALQLCYALRGRPAVVVVRSDSGRVYVLCPGDYAVEVGDYVVEVFVVR